MGIDSHEAVNQFKKLMDQVEEPLKRTFKNVHQGHVIETLERFLKAREWNVSKAYKMLVDSLQWRLQNGIDDILAKPILPANFYRGVRDSQLIGLSGYTKEGLPVFAIGAGLSTYDKASVHYYVQSHIQINEYRDRVILPKATKRHERYIGKCVKVIDMNGLKLSALNQLKEHLTSFDVLPFQLLQTISTVDDLNYPEKTITYYVVNVPYIFSACWKVVKPLLQERTKLKIRVLQGGGRDELLKIMDNSSLPHFCRRDESGSGSVLRSWSGSWSWSGSGSGSVSSTSSDDDCFSLDHPFHQELYSYMKQQSAVHEPLEPSKQGSVHVEVPLDNHENADLHRTLESELKKLQIQNTRSGSLEKVNASD